MELRRERVILAKLGAALIAGVSAVVFSLIVGAIATVLARVIYGSPACEWSLTAAGVVNSFTIQMFGLLVGFAFAALILNTPGAVAYFALPTVLSMLTELVP